MARGVLGLFNEIGFRLKTQILEQFWNLRATMAWT